MSDPFDRLSCEEEINPEHWREETRLHTPTFEALLQADGPLYLSGSALQEGFSVEAVPMLEQRLLEIGLYFDARTGPATKAHMSLEDVGKKLFAYELPPESPGLLMFCNY